MDAESALKELTRLLTEPCPEDDCGEILSSCCKAPVNTLFEVLPVIAECTVCKNRELLRDLVKNS